MMSGSATTKGLRPVHIDATTLPDAWYQTVYKCIESGRDFKIDRGSYEGEKRLEFDYITVHIKKPGERPLLPQIPGQYNLPNPVEENYLDDYLPYLMTGETKPGESYTYGQRICRYPLPINIKTAFNNEKNADIYIQEKEPYNNDRIIIEENGECFLNQMELLIWTYKNKGHRNNQMVLQVAHPTDMLLMDPPCLRAIDTRIQDGRLNFIIYFRSWDLWGGFPANLAAMQMMKEYIASEIGVEDGEMICSSKGLHIYNYVWELAECLRGKTIEEFRKGV
ncbi:MAG: thymidylate synthase [Spirochaetes bacterium]|nr:thymidylate synthase [Spirochaetota bacterium]